MPTGFGDEPERMCVLELACAFPASQEEAPDAPGELADAVTALRAAGVSTFVEVGPGGALTALGLQAPGEAWRHQAREQREDGYHAEQRVEDDAAP